jgi:hypothetical protein
MNKKQAVVIFKETVMPLVLREEQKSANPISDPAMRHEAWSFFVDGLCRDGMITPQQYARWGAPSICDKRR